MAKRKQDLRTSRQRRLRRRTLGGYRYVRLRWRLLFGLIDLVGTAIVGMTKWLRWADDESREPPKRILLVQFDHLGDAVITTGMLAALRRTYPASSIEVLAAPWNRAIFDASPAVDFVHVCPQNRFAPQAGLTWIPATILWGLRLRHRYDLAIDVRGEFPHNVLLWLTGARRRVGWSSGGGGFLLTDAPSFVANRPEHESRAALLACLPDFQGVEHHPPAPAFPLATADTETAETAWQSVSSAHARTRRVVFHIGAGTSAKSWPAEHWRRLVHQFVSDGTTVVALVGTGHDRETARAILGPSAPPGAVDWTGRFNLTELAAVLQQAQAMLGADSGPAHLAAAVGTPVLALFSGTNRVAQWRPHGGHVAVLQHKVTCSPCHRRDCPHAEHPCMRGIRPTAVARALAKMLAGPVPADVSVPLAAATEKGPHR